MFVTIIGPGCIYGVFSTPNWIDITGVPNSSFSVTVEPNLGPFRTGGLTVKALQKSGNVWVETGLQVVVSVTQPTGTCPYSFDKTTQNIGGNTSLYGFLNVTTSPNCPLNATSNANWIAILSGTNLFGSGQLEYTVAKNSGVARTGKITLGNATYTVNQGSGCSYEFNTYSKAFDAGGGSGSINVTASDAACPRNLTSSENWITIIGGNNSNGSGPVTYTVASNNGPPRGGEIKISGAFAFTISQAAGCSFTLSPSIFNFQPGTGVSSIQVTASSSLCAWSPMSNDPWVKITSAANVTGNGTVTFTVDANPGAARTTTITVGSKIATINQFGNQSGGDCTYSITPGSYQFGASGGEVSVNVTTSKDSCKWYVLNIPPFISVVNGVLSGTTSGVVKLKAQANAGAARSGSVDIAGKTFSITQDAVNPQTMTIIDLSPGSTAAGSGSMLLVVKGTNFTNTCHVRWNGGERPTTFYNSSMLGATISANDIANEGAFDVMVANTSNGAKSNVEEFMVYGATANVSSASFKGESLAPASLVSAFGVDLSKEVKLADSQPPPTELAGTTVTITDAMGNDHKAQILFVSPGQVNYLMPQGVVLGKATVTIKSGSGHTSVDIVEIASVAPGMFSANSTGKGLAAALALRVKANGQQAYDQTVEYNAATGIFTPKPIDLKVPGEQVYLVLFGTGLRYRSSLGSVSLDLGGVAGNVLYAGEAPGYAGLDQINSLAPFSLAGRGEVDVTLTVDGKKSNTVRLSFK